LSRRKNGIIFIAIVLLCFLLLTQLMGDQAQNTPSLQNHEQVSGSAIDPNIIQGNETIELTATVFMKLEEFKLMSEWNEEYQQLHPGTSIKLTNLGYEQSYLYLKEQARSGQSSSIMMLDNNWISEFAARGYLSHRIKDFIPSETAPSFNPNIAQTEWNGYTWAVPHSVDPYIIVWNPALVKNEDKSELPKSLDQWQVLHDSLLMNDPAYEGIYVNTSDEQAFISLILAFQGNWSKELEQMYTLNSDQDLSLLEQLMSTENGDNKDGLTKPLVYMEPLTPNESWDKFKKNQFAAMVVPLSEWMTHKNGEELISVSLLSGDSQQSGLWLSGSSYAVSSQTLHQEMAYSWITWMTNLTHQIQTLRVAYKLPANVTALDTNSFLSLPYPDVLSKAVEEGRAWSQDPQLSMKLSYLNQGIADLVNNPSSIKQWNEHLEQLWSQNNAAP